MTAAIGSVRQLIDSAGLADRAEARIALEFDHLVVGVRSNSRDLIDALNTYFTGFSRADDRPADIEVLAVERPLLVLDLDWRIHEPEPGKGRVKEEYVDLPDGRVVKKTKTGMIFAFGNGHNLAVGPCLENDNQVINFINNRLLEWRLRQGDLLAHAAAVLYEGKGLSLCGFSGAGKSTLALHLMSLGTTFVSNDRLTVEDRGDHIHMHGVPKLPRINPGTALNNPDLIQVIPEEEKQEFADLTEDEIWTLEHKYDASIEECFGPDRFQLSGPMDAMVILNWKRGAGPHDLHAVDINQRADLLPAVMKSPGVFYSPSEPEPKHDPAQYQAILSRVTVFEISGGVDFLKAAAELLEAMKQL
jgi:HprK-related kinase B